VRGKQLKVYLHPDDHAAVEHQVERELGSLLLLERSPDPTDFVADGGRLGAARGMGRLVCPASLVGELQPRFIQTNDEWMLNLQANPVIEWWFSKLADGVLYPGRFFALPASTYAETFRREELEEFTSVTTNLFRWVRSWTVPVETDWGAERLGPKAAVLVSDGDLSLRRNPPGSRL
jgi:hypothetical protein